MSDRKIARLCWNTNNWTKPSGSEGKITNGDKGEYEKEYGFGHEEWLFDIEKLIEGYHYGFIQGLWAPNHKNKIYDISLYTINTKTKERWWIGRIKRAFVLSRDESLEIQAIYEEKKWLDEMETQVTNVSESQHTKIKKRELALFNVKFSLEDLEIQDPPICIGNDDPAITSFYYKIQNWKTDPVAVQEAEKTSAFNFIPGHHSGEFTSSRENQGGVSTVYLEEKKLQERLYKHLCKEYGEQYVGTEQNVGYGKRIDIVLKKEPVLKIV